MSLFIKANLIGLALLFSIPVAYTQSFINYSIAEGLPSNEVYDIHQDKDGFLWFATDNGVVRYDGNEMKTLHTKDGLSDPVVFSFYEDFKSRIWFKTYSGRLSYYEPLSKKIYEYQFNDSLSFMTKSGLLSLHIDTLNNVSLSQGITLAKINARGNVTTTEVPLKSFTYQDLDSVALLGFHPQNAVIDQAVINNTAYPIQLTKTDIQNHVVCFAYLKGKLYFSINIDLFEYSHNKVRKVLAGRSAIISLSQEDNNLWIGYLNSGVDIFKGNRDEPETFPLFRDQSVTTVLRNRDGSHWFSTLENGVYHVPDRNVEVSPYLKEEKIKCILYANKTIIIGDQKGYVHFFDPVTRKEKSVFYAGGPVMSLFKDEENKVWMSTNHDVLIFNSENQLVRKISQLSKIDFTGDKDHRIWGVGVFTTLFNLEGDILGEYKTGSYRSVIAQDSLLFFARKLGIEIRSQKSFAVFSTPQQFRKTKIRKIDYVDDAVLLLSTIGEGPILLSAIKNSNPEYLTSSKRIQAENIYAASKTGSTLWLGTENGLFSIDVDSMSEKNSTFKQLTKQNGLLNNKIDFIVNTPGKVWVFSDDGISILQDTSFNFTRPNPAFYIKDVFINDTKTGRSIDKGITLSPLENYLRIDVGFIYFRNQQVSLRFRLSDHNEWSYSTNRSIDFFALSPGNYQLDLDFSTDGLKWNSAIRSMTIEVQPPWWKIWYVRVLFILFILILVYIYIRNRISLITQRQTYLQSIATHQDLLIKSEIESVEKERSRIVKDLHDGLGTSLVTLKMMVTQLIPQKDNLRQTVDAHFQETLEELSNVIYDISPPGLERYGLLTGLRNYIDRINRLLPMKIELTSFGDEINHEQVKRVTFRVIQELLTNSLKHSKANKITIHINSFKDILNIIFEDNGVGIDNLRQSTGIGLSSIEYRIKLLKGIYSLESSASGTSFIIDIPQPLENDSHRTH